MKILYVADFEDVKNRAHLISWEKLNALISHPYFVCVDVRNVPFSVFGGVEYRDLIKEHKPDIFIHDAIYGNGKISVRNIQKDIPAVLMIEEYLNMPKAIVDRTVSRGWFSNYISIPLSVKKQIPNSYWIGHHIGDYFDDYSKEKTFDVVSYGLSVPEYYPFRHRLIELMKRSGLKYFHANVYGKSLAEILNASHLVISCTSVADFMVKKYLEVPACKSTVLGDVNEECRTVYPDNEGILEVNMKMSDDDIMEIIHEFLNEPTTSQKAYETARKRTVRHYAENLIGICQQILEEQ